MLHGAFLGEERHRGFTLSNNPLTSHLGIDEPLRFFKYFGGVCSSSNLLDKGVAYNLLKISDLFPR